jgi:hypothetical protein
MRALRLAVLPFAAAALAAACSDASTAPRFDPSLVRVDSVDASAGWVYLSLANPASPLALTDAQAATSTAWDVAFRGYDAKINGGETGPGAVAALCVCANFAAAQPLAAAAQAQFYQTLTAESEATDYVAVTPQTVPAASAFVADTLPAIREWWVTANGARVLRTGPAGVYVVDRPGAAGGFAKVQFTSLQNSGGATPGTVAFRYQTTGPARTAWDAERTGTVTVPATGRVAFSFTTNAVVAETAPYDLLFEGWRVRTNSGRLASVPAADRSWGAYDATRDLGATSVASFEAAGVRAVSPTSFGYIPDGAGEFNRRPTWFYDFVNRFAIPTYDVYLVRRGPAVWKLQVIRHPRESSFGNGQWISRFVLFRTSQIAG